MRLDDARAGAAAVREELAARLKAAEREREGGARRLDETVREHRRQQGALLVANQQLQLQLAWWQGQGQGRGGAGQSGGAQGDAAASS